MRVTRASWRGMAILAAALLAAEAFVAAASARAAQEPGAAESTTLAADWPMERITLSDGKKFEGLVQSEGPASIEFVEVRRPRGKAMFLVVRTIDRKDIANWDRLRPEQQRELQQRLERYKRRTLVEGRRMEDLGLAATSDDGQVVWNYHGTWFTLESTAEELMTRRLIVRLEQIFAAYRQLVAPRWTGRGRVEVRVYGSVEQYRAALAELGLRINNPAVFLPDQNLIVAGSDVNRFDVELAQVNRQHREIRRTLDAQMAEAPARVKKLDDELKRTNVPAADRLRIVLAEQRKWTDQRKAAQRKIAQLDRDNAAKFNEVTAAMFKRLAHEAFHAYLETYVYPRRAHDVPRWLNEGLAQTFEAGLLEADSLRIDAPNLVALAKLQEDLRGGQSLKLADLLNARSETFLGIHDGDGQMVSRAYYYSWGLAYYLAFEQGVLGTAALDEYLSPASADVGPVERFEKLVGGPLSEFEPRWQKAMLGLKAK
jgi:Protein of unknown function (DUF1570)